MAQRTTIAPEAEIEAKIEVESTPEVETCRHHWVIQPADGPVSNGSCQVCGEIREFKNYVESATWGDSRITNKGAAASASVESTSDDEDLTDPGAEEEPKPSDAEIEVEV